MKLFRLRGALPNFMVPPFSSPVSLRARVLAGAGSGIGLILKEMLSSSSRYPVLPPAPRMLLQSRLSTSGPSRITSPSRSGSSTSKCVIQSMKDSLFNHTLAARAEPSHRSAARAAAQFATASGSDPDKLRELYERALTAGALHFTQARRQQRPSSRAPCRRRDGSHRQPPRPTHSHNPIPRVPPLRAAPSGTPTAPSRPSSSRSSAPPRAPPPATRRPGASGPSSAGSSPCRSPAPRRRSGPSPSGRRRRGRPWRRRRSRRTPRRCRWRG